MSQSSPSRTESVTVSGALPSLSGYGTGLKTGVTRVAFYTAIVLPFLHVPLLATGLDSMAATTAFAALVALNVIAAIVGQSHHTE